MKNGLKKRLVSVVSALAVLLSVTASPLATAGEGLILPASAAGNVITEALTEEPETEPDLSSQCIELLPDSEDTGKSVTLNGMMPEGASVTAVDVTFDYTDISSFTGIEEPEASVLAAYDITISDGESEYQPDEGHPILVEITDPLITANGSTELWHIADSGEREQITDFTVSDGRISFYAVGFSVYAIVEAPDPQSSDHELVTDIGELTGGRASDGFYLFYGNGNYFTSAVNGNNALVETTDIANASVWYFETANGGHRIYTMVNGQKRYIHNTSGNLIDLSTSGDIFTISESTKPDSYYLNKQGTGRYLQHSNGGGGIRYYTDNNNETNSSISMYYAGTSAVTDDFYKLDGKTYGLMSYISGPTGNAFTVDVSGSSVTLYDTVVRTGAAHDSVYVTDNEDITLWTFHSISGDLYTLSATVGGETKYLKLTPEGISLVSESEASQIQAATIDTGKIRLTSGGAALAFDKSTGFRADASGAFGDSSLLSFVVPSELSENNLMTYSAEKISVTAAQNGENVIVFTRAWNDTDKRYEFYAIDHDGSLVRCYESGDDITWIGTQLNTLEWRFTENYETDGTPNYYYELYNPYSGHYLVPQLDGGLIFSDTKKSINLPGRRANEYYSNIVAWDDTYFAYAGLKADTDTGTVESSYRSQADTFYFARLDPLSGTLTEVDTIDNSQYGITMKMVDFNGTEKKYTGCSSTVKQHGVIGYSVFDSNNPSQQTSGLLTTDIGSDGYPTAVLTGKSLSELFGDATEVNHLFISSTYEDSGYFEYDSCQNFASLLPTNNGNFTVYKELGTIDTTAKNSLRHGQFMPYNMINPDMYSKLNPENLYNDVLDPLDPDDPRIYEKLYDIGKPDHYFGMEVSASFFQTPNGCDAWGHDMIFEFTGDDDFWFYLDDELVIDLGGIHSALGGSINYATGQVIVNGETKTLRQVFRDNYLARNPGASESDVENYLAEYFEPGKDVFRDYSTHTMKIYYMERGGGASNLHMRFNLSSVNPNSAVLTKTVSGAEDLDYNLVEYPFRIWYRDKYGDEYPLTDVPQAKNIHYQDSVQIIDYEASYTPVNSTYSYSNVYFIDPDKKAVINFPEGTVAYRIEECGINPEVYDEVRINGTLTGPVENSADPRKSYDSGWLDITRTPNLVFDNHVDEDSMRTLSVTKRLYDENGHLLTAEEDPARFQFRLYLASAEDDGLTLANMHKYRVRDPEGYLCTWDYTNLEFISTTVTDYSELTDEEDKRAVTFDTSMNGAISDVPAGYTIEVVGLPVGTRFMLIERDSEVPVGYKRMRYEREGGSYIEYGDTVNSGTVRANESPRMYVDNMRGIGILANKVWADADFTDEHPPVYTAVFIGNSTVPVTGTVRKLSYPGTSVNYFFEELEEGKTIDDYKIREVRLTDPVTEDDRVISYSSIERVENDGSIELDTKTYYVSYEEGEVTGSTDDIANARTDTMTNRPEGGLAIRLFDWGTGAPPLPGGTFTLTLDGVNVGAESYTSAEDGMVTVLYSYEPAREYVLTQTAAPARYAGLASSVTFVIDEDGTVTITETNGEGWVDSFKADLSGRYLGYIDVHNRPFEFRAVKTDETDPERTLAGAHFALHRSVASIGGPVKDYAPLAGYEDLVTGSNGVIPKINESLPPGRYYLVETQSPEKFDLIDHDIIFSISPLGVVAVESEGHEDLLTVTENGSVISCGLNVPDKPTTADLTVMKTVCGSLGNKNKAFTFTLTVTGDHSDIGFEWKLNGRAQDTKLHTGETFRLKDGESAVISIPALCSVTVSEDNAGYNTTMRLGSGTAEGTTEKTFTLEDDIVLRVVNSLDSVIPTGVRSGFAAGFALVFAAGLGIISELAMKRRRKRSRNADAV